MAYLLAIDQGTSSSRAIVFDQDGRVVAVGQRTFDQLFPHDGWVEQEPEALWQATLAAAREAIAESGIAPTSIAAVGIANQRETTLVWDAETGQPFGNAIVWQDRRTAERCERARRDGMEPELIETTGLVIDPYFSSTKLEWLLARDGLASRAAAGKVRFGTVDSFLIWRLTKGASHVTDATNASRTQLFDISRQAWSESALDYFGVPKSVLPSVHDCVDDFGIADAEWFGAPIPIRGVAGDQQAALVGQGCLATGPDQEHLRHGLLSDRQHRFRTRTLQGAPLDHRGLPDCRRADLRRRRQHLQRRRRHQVATRQGRLDRDRRRHRSGGPAHRRRHRRRLRRARVHRARRAALAAGCARSHDRVDPRHRRRRDRHGDIEERGLPDRRSAHGGGCRRRRGHRAAGRRRHVVNNWFCQFLADVSGLEVARPANTETTAVGAGLLAAVGAGLYTDLDAAANAWNLDRPARSFAPETTAATRSTWLGGWHAAVERALNVPARDPLTGLLDRRGFVTEANRRLRLAARRRVPLALLYIDLDRFKQINDRFGHAVGDAVLHEFARAAEMSVRDDDIVARIGGEEFVILLVDTSLDGAKLVAERVRTETCSVEVNDLPRGFSVTASVGIAESAGGEKLDAFMARADAALYEAKAAGRDCVRVAAPRAETGSK